MERNLTITLLIEEWEFIEEKSKRRGMSKANWVRGKLGLTRRTRHRNRNSRPVWGRTRNLVLLVPTEFYVKVRGDASKLNQSMSEFLKRKIGLPRRVS